MPRAQLVEASPPGVQTGYADQVQNLRMPLASLGGYSCGKTLHLILLARLYPEGPQFLGHTTGLQFTPTLSGYPRQFGSPVSLL